MGDFVLDIHGEPVWDLNFCEPDLETQTSWEEPKNQLVMEIKSKSIRDLESPVGRGGRGWRVKPPPKKKRGF